MSTIDNDTANHTSSDDKYCDKLFNAKYLCTACGYNANDNSLLISLYCGDGVNAYTESGYNDFSLAIDYWFNLKKIKAAIEEMLLAHLQSFFLIILKMTPSRIIKIKFNLYSCWISIIYLMSATTPHSTITIYKNSVTPGTDRILYPVNYKRNRCSWHDL